MSALSTRIFLLDWYFLHLYPKLFTTLSNNVHPGRKCISCFIMGTTFAFVGTLFFLNCISDNTFIKVIHKHNVTWTFMLFYPGDLRCWVWIVVVLSLCFLLVLNIDDRRLPTYTAALSVALLMGNNNHFWCDSSPHFLIMFATFFLPSWWMEASLFWHSTWTQLLQHMFKLTH